MKDASLENLIMIIAIAESLLLKLNKTQILLIIWKSSFWKEFQGGIEILMFNLIIWLKVIIMSMRRLIGKNKSKIVIFVSLAMAHPKHSF